MNHGVDAHELVRQAWIEGLAPDPELTISQWADTYRMLPATSPEPGRWRTDRTPYLREIMDALSPNSPIEEVVIMAGGQVGKSETGNNFIGYIIHMSPGPAMLVQPTVDTGKDYARERIQPMIDATPELAEKVAAPRSRVSSNTSRYKEFIGGFLSIAGANSAAQLSSKAIRFVFLDEIDRYPLDVDGQGDPIGLVEKRQANFTRRKTLKTSTPTEKDVSRIDSEFKNGDQRRYFVPCPHCQHKDYIRWKNIRWPSGKPQLAHLICEACGGIIEERHKTWMLAHGEWRATAVSNDPKAVSYHLPAMYSPLGWRSWAGIARDFIEANTAKDRGDDTLLKKVINLDFGEVYDESDTTDALAELKKRKENYRLRTVPFGGLVLTAGVDVQDNRLELAIKAWGPGEESFIVDWQTIWGDTASDLPWLALDEILRMPLEHASGQQIPITAAAIDSGGHRTHEVYQFSRERRHRHILAVKGHSLSKRPVIGKPSKVDVNYRGVMIKGGAEVWPLGTDTAKSLIYGRLKVDRPGPGCMHFSEDLPEDYYNQLTAERKVTRYLKGHARIEWVMASGARNEALDCEVYALAAAHYIGIHRYRAANWEQIAMRVQPKQLDMLNLVRLQPQELPAPAAETRPPAPTAETQAIAPANWQPRQAGWTPRHLR